MTVDGSGAGSGNLEILVNGGHVTSFVRNLGNQRFLASFVPHEALSHLVEMKFNGETVPGKCKILVILEDSVWWRSHDWFCTYLGNQMFCASFFPSQALRHLLKMKINRKILTDMCRFCTIFS